MPKLPNSKLVLLIPITVILLFSISLGYIYYSQGLNKDVVAKVGNRTLTKDDLATHDRIFNGVLRFQQRADNKVVLYTSEEVLEDLIKVTKMEIEADKRVILPKANDIEVEKERLATNIGGVSKLKTNATLYGWSDSDLNRSIQIQLLKSKLEEVIVAWREAEFIALRWDVLKDRNPDVEFYRNKAQELLKAKEARFANGEQITTLANLCKEDKNILAHFPRHAIGSQQLSNDPKIRNLQKTTKDKTNVLDKKILTMNVPTKSEIWCNDAACYLVRVVGGNSGNFVS